MTPTLTHVADFLVEVGQPIAVGETAQGLRRVVPITGGTIRGARLEGTILNAGADFQIIGPDGFTRLEARYVVRLADGAMLYVENCGVRFGPPEADGAHRSRRAGRSGTSLFPQHATVRDRRNPPING